MTYTEADYTEQYKITQRADDAFQAAVIRQFGKRNAGDMRYRSSLHNAETRAAANAYHVEANKLVDIAQALRAAA